MTVIQIRSESKVYSRVSNPTVLYDKRDYVLLKIGEREWVNETYEYMRRLYLIFGFIDFANDLAVIELPDNQQLIDDIFQSTGRFEQFIKSEVEKFAS